MSILTRPDCRILIVIICEQPNCKSKLLKKSSIPQLVHLKFTTKSDPSSATYRGLKPRRARADTHSALSDSTAPPASSWLHLPSSPASSPLYPNFSHLFKNTACLPELGGIAK